MKISKQNIEQLKSLPETGMGYQLIEATKGYVTKEYIVFNGQLAFEVSGSLIRLPEKTLLHLQAENITLIDLLKKEEETVHLNNIKLKNQSAHLMTEKTKGAKDGRKETTNGDELFVRLSAFEDDIRIDKQNKCLLPGSYTTTASDALKCRVEGDEPKERYALPNELSIKWAFFIQPASNDILQRGITENAFNKRGGGREVYFEEGTSQRTFITQRNW